MTAGVPSVVPVISEPVKTPLTAETAKTAEKKILRILGELCVLCGKTSHFFHTLSDVIKGIGGER